MKFAYTAALMSFALTAEVAGDECADSCNKAFGQCEGAPGADLAVCSNKYTECLGYDQYATSPYVKPTACTKGPVKPPGAGGDAECADSCNKAFGQCEGAKGADLGVCSIKYTECLGYDPYATSPYVKPTACIKGPVKPTGSAVPDECCKKCTADHEACKGAPNADKTGCEKKYSDCLGYNPFQGPWVQPTTCQVQGSKLPGHNGDIAPVVVAGGSNLKPALAVLALGALALF